MAFQGLSRQIRCIKHFQDLFHIKNNTISVCGSSLKFSHSYFTVCSIHSSLTQNNTIPENLIFEVKGSHQRHLHSSVCRDAGHSKWSNIKHIKGAQDQARGEKTNTLARKLRFVLSKNPEKNPKLNTELANLIKWARTNNIPNDIIDRTVERTIKLRDPANLTAFDGRGPSNTAIILECLALKPIHTKGLLQGVIKKYGFNLNSSATDLFDHKGIIETEVPESELETAQNDPDNFPLDKYIDIAIEAGAEDVTLRFDSEKPYLEFTCAPQDVGKVQRNVDIAGLTVTTCDRIYIPTMLVPASKEYLQSLEILKEKLDNHPDVIKYHFNIVPES